MIEGALKADGRIAAKNAVKIRAALRELADYKKLYLQYQETMPESSGNLARDRTRARAWAIMNVTQFRTEALASSLWRMWAEAYVLGTVAASEWLRITRELNKADDDVSVDWDNWKPGDRAATLMLQRPKAFQEILDSTNVTIRGLTRTSITDIGNSLAEAIDLGLDASSAALLISRNVASPARALTIAITEQNRVISAATMERYKEAGLEKQEWAVSDPCDICAKNDGTIVPIGTSFPSGDTQPPAHPHCRCVLLPVIPGMEGEPSIEQGNINILPPENKNMQPMPYVLNDKTLPKPKTRVIDYDKNPEAQAKFAQQAPIMFANVTKNPIKIATNEDSLSKIVKDKRLKNVHETPSSRVFRDEQEKYKTNRIDYETKTMGVPTNALNREKPIYGYFEGKDIEAYNYGRTTIYLKDSVKSRTSVTAGDSMNQSVPVLFSDIVSGKASIKDLELASSEYFLNSFRYAPNQPDYWEAQIYGGVTINDIQAIEITRGYVSQEIIDKLQKLGIQVIING